MIVRVVILALLMMLVGSGLILLAHSTTEPIRLVVYSAEVDGNRDIYIKTVDGKHVRRLTTDPIEDYYPVWSPDGKWITYFYFKNSTLGYRIYMMNLTGHNKKIITHVGSRYFIKWSPDSQWLFINYFTTGKAIHLGKNETYVSYHDANMNAIPLWTSDNEWLIHKTWTHHQNFAIVKVSPNFREFEIITTNDYYRYGTPILSPNEEWIIFDADVPGCSSFYLAHIKTHELKCVDVNGTPIGWSSDSSWIVFSARFEAIDKTTITKVRLDGTEQEELVKMKGNIHNIVWIPYEEWIYFVNSDIDGSKIYRVKSDGSNLSAIFTNSELIHSLIYFEAEQRIIFSDKNKNHWIRLDGSDYQYLADTYYSRVWENPVSPIKY